jgi:hypothetical protein
MFLDAFYTSRYFESGILWKWSTDFPKSNPIWVEFSGFVHFGVLNTLSIFRLKI